MNSTWDFKHMKAPRKRELQLVKDECDLLGAELKNAGQGEAANLEDSKILVAACRIVISGYRSEISREKGTSLFVRAAYELLHRFLEQQFESHSHAA